MGHVHPKGPQGFSCTPSLVLALPRVPLGGQRSELACLETAHTPQPWHAEGVLALDGWGGLRCEPCDVGHVHNPREVKLPKGSQLVPQDLVGKQSRSLFPWGRVRLSFALLGGCVEPIRTRRSALCTACLSSYF